MEKGYYCTARTPEVEEVSLSQSTIKMEKGYYEKRAEYNSNSNNRRNPQ